MESLPGFEDYIYAVNNELAIEYIDYANYLVAQSSYETILEDYLSDKIVKNNMTITSNDLRDLLFAFTHIQNEDNIDDLYNKLVEYSELAERLNLQTLDRTQSLYDNWLLVYERQLSLTLQRADLIRKDIDRLERFEKEYRISKPTVDTSHFESIIDVDEHINDLTALFDVFQMSEYFPALWYPTKKLLKTHSSYKGNASFTLDSLKNETLYILYGNNKTAEIHIEDGQFKITTTLMGKTDRDDLIDLFSNFPFKLDNLHENRVILTYQMKFEYPVSININSFLYAMMLDGFFSRYFHIMESNTLSTTNYIRLRYIFPFLGTNSEVIAFQLRGERTLEPTSHSRSRLTVSQFEEDVDEFIEIRIQALNHEAVKDYVEIIATFLAQYLREQEKVNAIVAEFTQDNEPLVNPKTRSTISRRSEAASRLSASRPSVSRPSSSIPSGAQKERIVKSLAEEPLKRYFISEDKAVKEIREHLELPSDYSRQCSQFNQPRVIRPELVNQFNEEKFLVDNVVHKRLALPFQVGDNTVYLGCPNDEYPFIGIRATRGNKIIPCCYGENQNVEGKHLYKYLKGSDVSINRFFSSSNLQSLNILPPGTTGILPDSLKGLFKIFNPNMDYLRYGSVPGLQTFLHAILLSLDDDYIALVKRSGSSRNNDLEAYVIQKRQRMAEEISDAMLNTLKEALPDMTYEEMRELIRNERIYVDPKIFITLFENYFKIRLLVLELDENKKITLVQPDYMIFRGSYPVSYKDDPIPSLNKNQPSEDIPLVAVFGQRNIRTVAPQWELIVHQERSAESEDKKKGIIRVAFEGEITERLTFFFLDKIPTYQLYFDQNQRTMYLSDRLWFNVNALLRRLSFITKIELRGQSIDTLGKTRVLYFNAFSLMIPPITPLAIPIIEDEPYNKNNVKHIGIFSKLFGKIRNVHRSSQGLYWRVDWTPESTDPIEMKISYLFKPTTEFKHTYDTLINSEIEDYRTIPVWKQIAYFRKTAKRLQRLLCYLFLKYLEQEDHIRIEDVTFNLQEWQEKFIIDENVIYDFSSLYGLYPEGEYVNVLDELRPTGLVDKNRDVIILTNETVKKNLFSYVKRWCLNREGVRIDRLYQVRIEGFYETSSDFKQWNNTRIYVGENAVKAFLAEQRNVASPEIVKGPFRQISLLQPVDRWEYAALRSVSWQEEKINSYQPSFRIPQMGKMTEAELERSAGTTNTKGLLYYIEDQAPGRGIARPVYKAIIPLADNVK